MKTIFAALAASLMLATAGAAFASAPVSGPEPAPATPKIAAPQDVPFSGTIGLAVDATDLSRHIFRVRESIPVSGPGAMTL
ncbi:MAG: peptidase M61, partial [Alphaproteobacteria bacterium]|nr:peptidase M61 [Alphaproteobacteria bacterium]